MQTLRELRDAGRFARGGGLGSKTRLAQRKLGVNWAPWNSRRCPKPRCHEPCFFIFLTVLLCYNMFFILFLFKLDRDRTSSRSHPGERIGSATRSSSGASHMCRHGFQNLLTTVIFRSESCMFIGSTRSGSILQGVKSSIYRQPPRKVDPKDLCLWDVSWKNGHTWIIDLELHKWGHMTTGHRLLCKELLCFIPVPCRHTPLLVNFWIVTRAHRFTSKLRPPTGLSEPKEVDEVSNRISPTSHRYFSPSQRHNWTWKSTFYILTPFLVCFSVYLL